MNVWASPDRFHAITAATKRRARSEDLVAEITDALAVAGEYSAWIAMEPRQRVVDFAWAAHQAGRRLGLAAHVDLQMASMTGDGRIEVRVTTQRPHDHL